MNYEVKGEWEDEDLFWVFRNTRNGEVFHRVSDRELRSKVSASGDVIRKCHTDEYFNRLFT